MRRYGNRKQDEEEESKLPGWLSWEDNSNRVQRNSKSKPRRVQQHGDRDVDGGQLRRIRQPQNDVGQPISSNTQRTCTEDRSSKTRATRRTKYSKTSETIVYTFTLQQIYEALTIEQINQLLNSTYDPNAEIEITKEESRSSFLEDSFFDIPKLKHTKNVVVRTDPSKTYYDLVSRHTTGDLDKLTPELVAGYYFYLYKRLFHEEDPEWTGRSLRPALETIRSMVLQTAGNDYSAVIEFLKKILPLWKQRLLACEDFPNNRPTIETMFGKKRYFWANRKLLYKRWSNG